MRVKTSELTGAALDWAVAKCEEERSGVWATVPSAPYSTNWALGGPIIEREKIRIEPSSTHTGWFSVSDTGCYAIPKPRAYSDGPTPLIAAMRCFTASRLGDEVDVPDVLLEETV
jgi:hypothetical protein